jgi:hypothetical protein
MSKPFQFSMSWLFYGITWFCVAAWLLSILLKNGVEHYSFLPLLCFTIVGANIGAIGGRTMAGALLGAVVAIVGYYLMPIVH